MRSGWSYLWRHALVLCVTFRDQFCGNSGLRSMFRLCGLRRTHVIELAVSVASVDTIVCDAVFEAWHALSGVMRSSHAKTCRSGHRQGFVQPRWGGHISGRAQERILTSPVLTDARVSALESAELPAELQGKVPARLSASVGSPS